MTTSCIISLNGLVLFCIHKRFSSEMKRCSQAHPLWKEQLGPFVKQHTLDQKDGISLVLGRRHFNYCTKK